MKVLTIGIDLAKSSFSLHGVDQHGKVKIRKTVKRHKLLETIAQLPSSLIAMEACSGAHHWSRVFQSLEQQHDVRIIAPKYVAPYRKGGKNDSNDAEAICEAASRPNMRFVSVKSVDQQAVLCVHRTRQALVQTRTAFINQIRGLLSEFGIVMAKGRHPGQKALQRVLEDAENSLPWTVRQMIDDTFKRVQQLTKDVLAYDRLINHMARESDNAQRIMEIPGVGAKTATAVIATVGQADTFHSSRQFSAWLGLTPKQYSTGGVTRLGRITRRGDKYLRTLLVHGARSVVLRAKEKKDRVSLWVQQLLERRGYKRTVVAVAAKNARMIWALLAHETEYKMAI